MSTSLPNGTRIGAYRIERRLGRGGMSTVYLAEQSGLKRKVALKVMSADLAEDERFRERFVRESELAASLDAPNVLPVYEAGEHDGVLFIAMRFVDGTDLKGLLEQGPLDPALAVDIVTQVARALDAAHAKGLVHRDVKPANILLARGGATEIDHVYLSDFGLTKRAASDSGLTGTGVFAGTLSYAAPEQFEGKRLDARTDVYSLGCVVFECLTGSPPFRKEQDAALMYSHLNEPPPSAAALRPDLPAGIDLIIAKAMAKRSDDRYGRAGELATALDTAIGRPGWPEAEPTRPKPFVWLAVAAALLLGIAGVIVALTRGNDTPARTAASPSVQAHTLPPQSLARIDPGTGEPSTVASGVPGLAVRLPVRPNLAIGEGGVWLYSFDIYSGPGKGGFLLDADPVSGEVRKVLPVGIAPGSGAGLAVGSRTVWFSGSASLDRVSRINPSTYEPLDPVEVSGGTVTDILLVDGRLYVGSNGGTITVLDALTGHRLDEIRIGASPDALAYGADSLWAMDALGNEVIRVDPGSDRVIARIPLPGNLKDIAAGDGGVWVLDQVAGTATQIDPDSNSPDAPVGLGPDPTAIAVGLGSAWVADAQTGDLYRIDPELERATTLALGTPLAAVAVDDAGDAVWVGTFATD